MAQWTQFNKLFQVHFIYTRYESVVQTETLHSPSRHFRRKVYNLVEFECGSLTSNPLFGLTQTLGNAQVSRNRKQIFHRLYGAKSDGRWSENEKEDFPLAKCYSSAILPSGNSVPAKLQTSQQQTSTASAFIPVQKTANKITERTMPERCSSQTTRITTRIDRQIKFSNWQNLYGARQLNVILIKCSVNIIAYECLWFAW